MNKNAAFIITFISLFTFLIKIDTSYHINACLT